MMFKCYECGHLFEDGEQARWTEPHGERCSGCPICAGGYTVVYPCKICGGYTEEDYCEDCKADVKKRFENILDKEFTKEERELLNELYDGERL
jgi:hypothetical protein